MKKLILTVLFTAMALTTAHALSWSQMAAAVDNQPNTKYQLTDLTFVNTHGLIQLDVFVQQQ